MRALGPVLLLLVAIPALPGVAGDDTQVGRVGDWEEAFKLPRKTERPVMVCLNSKGGEQANERAARKIYHDPSFVPPTGCSRHSDRGTKGRTERVSPCSPAR